MVLPEVIPRQTNPAIASYEFQDLASGIGYETFYAVAQDEEALGTITRKLVTITSIYSNITQSTQNTQAATTFNFDTSAFNLPRTVKGLAIIQCTGRNNDADVVNCLFQFQLFKVLVDNTTIALTSLKTVDFDGNTAPGNALGANEKINILLFMETTQTTIKKGEKIRLAVTLDVKDPNDSINVYHDPLGRDLLSDTNFSSIMKVLMPFRVDN